MITRTKATNPDRFCFSPWCTTADCDSDGDGYMGGDDCDDTDAHTWDTCATCNDDDGDTYYELCNDYTGINGPD